MFNANFLHNIQRSEKSGRVATRLGMLIMLVTNMNINETARNCNCDPRTVKTWFWRLIRSAYSIKAVRKALSDKPRSGCPTKIPKEKLDQAKKWCEDSAFTPEELGNYLYKISGVRLSQSQVRRYARKWEHSRKKMSPIHVKKTPIEIVEEWQKNVQERIIEYLKQDYAIATQDESNFKDAVLSTKFWSKIGVRLLLPWSGGHSRFSMFCTMTMDGQVFFNHCKTTNTETFLEHLDIVRKKVGKMVIFLDRAPWHTSTAALEYFKKYGIIVIWYPVGHPYLNPVENMWGVLKRKIDHAVRYADLNTHLQAVYNFLDRHKFDYNFSKFWNRKPPKGIMRPFVSIKEEPKPSILALRVGSTKKDK